jgi:hypothetical protein
MAVIVVLVSNLIYLFKKIAMEKTMAAKQIGSQRHHIKGSSEGTGSQRKAPQPAPGAQVGCHAHSRRA